MSNRAHKNRLQAKEDKIYNEQLSNAQRAMRRYGADGKRFNRADVNLFGEAMLFKPENDTMLLNAIAKGVPKTVDMRHEARLRAFHGRKFDKENKARGTQSSATRVPVK